MFSEYPYLNKDDLNLDYLLKKIKELVKQVNEFIGQNTIKYADPIAWNITTQYEKNTVVVDPATGIAYISVQPVPSGVGIGNTDYWSPIFMYDSNYVRYYDTVSDMVSDTNLYAGTFCRTAGHNAINDGGGALYLITTAAPAIYHETLNNGMFASIIFDDELNVCVFGAVGDGATDDTAAINRALSAAATMTNPIIVFPENHTFMVSRIRITQSGLTLLGRGGVIKALPNTASDSSQSYYLIDSYSNDNVTIDGLVIDGNAANNTQFAVFDAITLSSGDNMCVRNCTIKNAADSAIMFSNVTNSICVDNLITNYYDCGIYANIGNNSAGSKNIISRNIVNAGTGSATGSGIAVKRNGNYFMISDNVVNGGTNGITMENASSATDYSSDCMITNNQIIGVQNYAINLRVSNHCTVIGNYIRTFTSFGILINGSCQYNTIANNTIITTSCTAGIALTIRDNRYPQNNSITGNTVQIASASGHAFDFQDGVAPGAQATGNVIDGNVFINTGGVAAYYGQFGQRGIFSNNMCQGSSVDAVFNAGRCVWQGNSFYNSNVTDGMLDNGAKVGQLGTIQIFRGSSAAVLTTLGKPGDIILNTSPQLGGNVGWIYVGTGWKTFGTIQS